MDFIFDLCIQHFCSIQGGGTGFLTGLLIKCCSVLFSFHIPSRVENRGIVLYRLVVVATNRFSIMTLFLSLVTYCPMMTCATFPYTHSLSLITKAIVWIVVQINWSRKLFLGRNLRRRQRIKYKSPSFYTLIKKRKSFEFNISEAFDVSI